MTEQTRAAVFSRLQSAPADPRPTPRPKLPQMPEASMNREQLVEKFKGMLEAQTGVFKRARGNESVMSVLAEVFEEEAISGAAASTDPVTAELELAAWASLKGYTIRTRAECADRQAFKNMVFNEVQAGITGVDYGFAESGTLCLLVDHDMPRLTSLAPLIHIAVLPVKRLVPNYEDMVDKVFKGYPPSQAIMITGPSMTADIQATPFKGMHGPRKLIVILKDD